ncbi:MAG TPA: FTR1 family protein [Dehalococcoidia bacterium]|nr:FTR1 family protein [Dehalococcoidia bacterium]
MIQALLITFREGLEMALVVVIVLAYLKAIGQMRFWAHAWAGTLAAVALSFAIGVGIFIAGGEFEGRAEALFEGVTMLTAVAVLSWMIIWMRTQSTRIRAELQAKVDTALLTGSGLAIAAVPFIAVFREGIETSLFMVAASETASHAEAAIGGGAGLVLAVLVGGAFYRWGRRVNLKAFFNVTGVLLIVVAAGLLARGVHELQEAEVIPTVNEHVWDMSAALSDEDGVGEWLKGLLGYNANPSLEEVVAYPLFLATALFYFYRPVQPAPSPAAAPKLSRGEVDVRASD